MEISEHIAEAVVLEEKKSEITYDMAQADWLEFLQIFCRLTSSSKQYLDFLQKEQSEADLEICDLLHYIELYEVDEEKYRRIVELLKEARQKRRLAKDGQEIVDWFRNSLGTAANLMKAQTIMKQIEKLDRRRYVPRKFPELFKGAVISMPSPKGMEEIACVSKREIAEEAEGEKPVYTTREETVFDTTPMDWLAFAQQQVTFYRDAEQYAYNLKLDLEEIDRKIESILKGIEDVNYNAVQGYMVFKELKDLRITRQKKEKEWNEVRILVEPFNCMAMADAFQESVSLIEKLEKDKDDCIEPVR